MQDGVHNKRRQQVVAPILREVFPDLPEEKLGLIHEGFVVLFRHLHRGHRLTAEAAARRSQLDDSRECDSLK